MSTWMIVGASRGIGLEFVRQLLDQDHNVIAVVRNVSKASDLWTLSTKATRPGGFQLFECDVTDDESIGVLLPYIPTPLPSLFRITPLLLLPPLFSLFYKYSSSFRTLAWTEEPVLTHRNKQKVIHSSHGTTTKHKDRLCRPQRRRSCIPQCRKR